MQPAEGSSDQSLQRSLPALLSPSISKQPAQFDRLTSTKSASHCDTTSAYRNQQTATKWEKVNARHKKKFALAPHPSTTIPSTHHVGRLERLETSNKQQKREGRASKGMVKGCAKLGHVQPRAKVPLPLSCSSFAWAHLLDILGQAQVRRARTKTMRSDVSDARRWTGRAPAPVRLLSASTDLHRVVRVVSHVLHHLLEHAALDVEQRDVIGILIALGHRLKGNGEEQTAAAETKGQRRSDNSLAPIASPLSPLPSLCSP